MFYESISYNVFNSLWKTFNFVLLDQLFKKYKSLKFKKQKKKLGSRKNILSLLHCFKLKMHSCTLYTFEIISPTVIILNFKLFSLELFFKIKWSFKYGKF